MVIFFNLGPPPRIKYIGPHIALNLILLLITILASGLSNWFFQHILTSLGLKNKERKAHKMKFVRTLQQDPRIDVELYLFPRSSLTTLHGTPFKDCGTRFTNSFDPMATNEYKQVISILQPEMRFFSASHYHKI